MKSIYIPLYDLAGNEFMTSARGTMCAVTVADRLIPAIAHRDYHAPKRWIITHYATGYRMAVTGSDRSQDIQDAVTAAYPDRDATTALLKALDELPTVNGPD